MTFTVRLKRVRAPLTVETVAVYLDAPDDRAARHLAAGYHGIAWRVVSVERGMAFDAFPYSLTTQSGARQ